MLELKNISKSFSSIRVLKDVSFNVEKGRVLALMGENGAGKSTLMKIISGIYNDYSGQIFVDGVEKNFKNSEEAEEAGIAIIHQELNLFPDLSVAENLLIKNAPVKMKFFTDKKATLQKAEEIASKFNFPFPLDSKVRNLGVGWQQIIEIARVLNYNSKIVIMDEPTSALSDSEIEILFDKIKQLKESGKLVIYISHRMSEVFEIADEIAVLRDGSLIGKYQADKLDRDSLVKLMIGKTIENEQIERNVPDEEEILKVENLTVRSDEKAILENVSFDLKKGEVLGVAGLLGSGRSSLLKFLFGETGFNYEGRLKYGNVDFKPLSPGKSIKDGIIYLTENRLSEGIFPELSLDFNCNISSFSKESKFGFISKKETEQICTDKLDELNTVRNNISQNIETLSGGNQQKVLLSRVLLTEPKLLLLDEPTRGIDVNAKYEIYKLIEELSKKGISVIVASSEIPELLKITSRILVLSNGCQTNIFDTNKVTSQEILQSAFTRV
ncbi:MAG: sugar ABC transporter ATP-binding protein [Rhodothermaceae bacterium]